MAISQLGILVWKDVSWCSKKATRKLFILKRAAQKSFSISHTDIPFTLTVSWGQLTLHPFAETKECHHWCSLKMCPVKTIHNLVMRMKLTFLLQSDRCMTISLWTVRIKTLLTFHHERIVTGKKNWVEEAKSCGHPWNAWKWRDKGIRSNG